MTYLRAVRWDAAVRKDPAPSSCRLAPAAGRGSPLRHGSIRPDGQEDGVGFARKLLDFISSLCVLVLICIYFLRHIGPLMATHVLVVAGMPIKNIYRRHRILRDPAESSLAVGGLKPSRRRDNPARTRQLFHAAVWLAGIAGFLIPLLMARTSAHAGLFRTIALAWFLAFSVINAILLARAFRQARPKDEGPRLKP